MESSAIVIEPYECPEGQNDDRGNHVFNNIGNTIYGIFGEKAGEKFYEGNKYEIKKIVTSLKDSIEKIQLNEKLKTYTDFRNGFTCKSGKYKGFDGSKVEKNDENAQKFGAEINLLSGLIYAFRFKEAIGALDIFIEKAEDYCFDEKVFESIVVKNSKKSFEFWKNKQIGLLKDIFRDLQIFLMSFPTKSYDGDVPLSKVIYQIIEKDFSGEGKLKLLPKSLKGVYPLLEETERIYLIGELKDRCSSEYIEYFEKYFEEYDKEYYKVKEMVKNPEDIKKILDSYDEVKLKKEVGFKDEVGFKVGFFVQIWDYVWNLSTDNREEGIKIFTEVLNKFVKLEFTDLEICIVVNSKVKEKNDKIRIIRSLFLSEMTALKIADIFEMLKYNEEMLEYSEKILKINKHQIDQERLKEVKEKMVLVNAKNAVVIAAVIAVVIAEDKKTQIDLDAAQVLVNKLIDGEEKTNLQKRLSNLQKRLSNLQERLSNLSEINNSINHK